MTPDKNLLFHTCGLLRWGTRSNGVITFEDLHTPGATYLGYSTEVPLLPIFSVEEQGRYPTKEEYALFIKMYRCR
jgi:hypothetical protein